MATLRLARPLWLDREHARAARRFPSLSGTISADVVVVGAGVTGAAIAWRLASAGARVVVLDGARAARGSTAASSALLMQEPDEDFSNLQQRYGAADTRRIWQLSRAATREFVAEVRRLRIACELSSRDSVYFTLDQEREGGLCREQRLRARAHCGGRWLGSAALERTVGFRGVAAIRTRGNAEADPVALSLGLLDAAERRGAAIFERSRVQHSIPDGSGVRVLTARGEVRCGRVVVATGYATREFKPLIGRFRLLDTYVVATEPVSSSMRRALGLSNVMIWDTSRPYHYARWSRDGRLLLGGGDRRHQAGARRSRALRAGAQEVREYFEALYPALRGIRTDYAWEGLFATTPDGLPYIGPHRRYPNHLFALGYGGNGMTFGYLAAKLIAERIEGKISPDHDLFAFDRLRRRRR